MKARKMITLLLAALMALSCFGALAEFTPIPVGQIGGNGTREYVEPPEGAWDEPYSEIVNIRTVKGQGSDLVFEPGEDQSNNEWVRSWYNDLGIEVTYDWIDEGNTQYTQKLNMTIATGDLPDVFRCNYIQFRQLMKAGLIQDLTEVYNKYTSDRIRGYEETDPDTIKLTTVDGKIYGIPIYYYGMSGQLKTLLDRLNPLYGTDVRFTEVYLIATSAESGNRTADRTVAGVQGWIDCFEGVTLSDVIFAGGVNDPGEISDHPELMRKAYDTGRDI